ncbi:AfsR/SARP family transcriptional regulator [Streptomyces sp. NBC_01465]|uniref:AfsR/SARP family transcriptional regulator n=1 Tax=Streptomyces sp. NBC_01465 TaxID=2903878 RepID=UPI002E376B99|nr:BTAD domain-containing putative transcriptional regulator [Streptomyces sp. NBC_01465]
MISFGILGPLTATAGARPLALGPYKQQLLLASLLCEPDAVVSVDHLVDTLWSEGPPKSAAKNLQVYVHHLRRTLESADDDVRILLQRPGYRLTVDPARVDRVNFEQGIDRARRATAESDPGVVDRLMAGAMKLWRGRPFAGLEGAQPLDEEADRLHERRLAALEVWFSARLALGRHQEVLEEVEPLVGANPYREQLRAHHMRALRGLGRQSDALLAYDEVRRLFSLELGLEPGTALRQLQQEILSGYDGRPDPAPADLPSRAQVESRPCATSQLPPGISDFTGRLKESAEILPDVTAHSVEPAVPWQLTVVTGRPGVGKSSTAIAAAHAAGEIFPGGRFHVDLADENGAPRSPEDALADLLRDLGRPAERLPRRLADLVRLYRARLTGRGPMLFLLDNAYDEAQVRPLLPSAPMSTTVVTSCSRLAALDGARLVELAPLSTADSVELLRRIVGPERVDSEPAAAVGIARACDRLPLALRIAGAQLAARRAWPLTRLAAQLGAPGSLDLFTVGDVDLRGRLMRGYQGVAPQDWALIRLLGTSAGFTFDDAVRVLDGDVVRAGRSLDRLHDLRLCDWPAPAGPDGARTFHVPVLVQALARELAPGPVWSVPPAPPVPSIPSMRSHTAAPADGFLRLPVSGRAPV